MTEPRLRSSWAEQSHARPHQRTTHQGRCCNAPGRRRTRSRPPRSASTLGGCENVPRDLDTGHGVAPDRWAIERMLIPQRRQIRLPVDALGSPCRTNGLDQGSAPGALGHHGPGRGFGIPRYSRGPSWLQHDGPRQQCLHRLLDGRDRCRRRRSPAPGPLGTHPAAVGMVRVLGRLFRRPRVEEEDRRLARRPSTRCCHPSRLMIKRPGWPGRQAKDTPAGPRCRGPERDPVQAGQRMSFSLRTRLRGRTEAGVRSWSARRHSYGIAVGRSAEHRRCGSGRPACPGSQKGSHRALTGPPSTSAQRARLSRANGTGAQVSAGPPP